MILGKPASPVAMQLAPCSKCGGDMEEGFVVDRAQSGSGVMTWVAGAPERGPLGGVKILSKTSYVTRTFRCVKCGFLESYAPG